MSDKIKLRLASEKHKEGGWRYCPDMLEQIEKECDFCVDSWEQVQEVLKVLEENGIITPDKQ